MPYYSRDPKRDHNFDNHPYARMLSNARISKLMRHPTVHCQALNPKVQEGRASPEQAWHHEKPVHSGSWLVLGLGLRVRVKS